MAERRLRQDLGGLERVCPMMRVKGLPLSQLFGEPTSLGDDST